MKYTISEGMGVEGLNRNVNKLILEGWKPLGGPFILPYAQGHGPLLAGLEADPLRVGERTPATIYYNVCQAMTLEEPYEVLA